MALARIRLGDYIVRSTKNNSDESYGIEYIAGVNSKGVFDVPKGNNEGVNLKPYKIVKNGAFVYNPTRLNLGSIAYRTQGLCIVSHLYMVFYLTEEGKKIIDPIWLYMYFRRDEFCREVTFRNFGSQRPEFSFNDMCDIMIPLPDISIQRKYVNIFNSMLGNLRNYEQGIEDLKLVCDAFIEELRNKCNLQRLGDYISLSEQKNEDLKYGYENLRGVSVEKEFILTKADMKGVSLKPYYVVKPNEFAYVTVTSRNGERISLARNSSDCTYICSSSYVVFRVSNSDKLLPEYLSILFERNEFNRYSRFHSWGSARETFDWEDMCEVYFPIPDIKIQQDIVKIFEVLRERKNISERLNDYIKCICPVLIKGSIDESKKIRGSLWLH